MTTKTPQTQLDCTTRYRKTSEKWTITAKENSRKAVLLEQAKLSKELPDRFWNWLLSEFDENGWRSPRKADD